TEVFQEIDSYIQSVKGVIEREVFFDKQKGKLYLVVKVDPEHSDNLIEELSSIDFSRDFPFYIYGVRSGG
ncbi:hypothetical protein ACFL9U_11260, partial [Thermodesulfobacteriota bacterium]